MNVSTPFLSIHLSTQYPLALKDESLSPILFPYDPSAKENLPVPSIANSRNPTTPHTPVVKAADLVPQETKVELVLSAEDDIKNADRIMREIQVLVERGADGSGDLACGCRIEEST